MAASCTFEFYQLVELMIQQQRAACYATKGAGLERVGCAEPGSDAGTREMAIYYRTRLIDYPTSEAVDK